MQRLFRQILIGILMLIICGCQGSLEPKALAPNKRINLEEDLAFNKELILNFDGDSIAAYAFIASGKSLKETIILIPGYPGNDTNFDIAQEIRRNGKNVIQFNHRGAWGSQGKYSYSNCLDDIEKIINLLSEDEASKKLRIKNDEFTLLGRSFGGGIALIKGSQLPAVQKIIAITSVNYGEIMKDYGSLNDLKHFKKYMQKQIMINHDIDQFLQELLDKKIEFDIVNYNQQLKDKDILLIEDSDKNEDWINQIEGAEYVKMESDHNFVNERVELEQLIVHWLNKKPTTGK